MGFIGSVTTKIKKVNSFIDERKKKSREREAKHIKELELEVSRMELENKIIRHKSSLIKRKEKLLAERRDNQSAAGQFFENTFLNVSGFNTSKSKKGKKIRDNNPFGGFF